MDRPARFCVRCVLCSLLIIVLAFMTLTPYLGRSTELVRMRNAWLLLHPAHHPLDWTPDAMPRDYLRERGPTPPFFVAQADRLGLQDIDTDWHKVTAISRHLLSHPYLVGTPIQARLEETYGRMLSEGTGYCGDFTRVFMALAIAAGLPVRAWSFSLDGFGGHGHIWPEIWNRQLNRWQLVDIFNNYYFAGNDGIAVSAEQFRSAMLTAPSSIRVQLLSPDARPGYVVTDKMWAWYAQGLSGWYMHWGNNVFAYDATLSEVHLGRLSYAVGQLWSIAVGIYPGISLWTDSQNTAQSQALWRLRHHLFMVAGVALGATIVAITCLLTGAGWVLRRHYKAKEQYGR